MKSLTPTLVLLLTAVTFAHSQQRPTTSADASSKPQAATNLSVTTVISNVDANSLTADIANDGLGTYADNVSGVTSYLTVNGYNNIKWGDWQFDVYSSTTRRVGHVILQGDAVQPGDPHYTAPANPPFWGSQTLKSRLATNCTIVNKNMLTMTAGATMTCGLSNHFTTTDGAEYGLAPDRSFSGFPETTDVQIACNAVDANGCKDWSIDPIAPGPAVGRLVLHPAKPNQPKVNDGDFYLRFHIHLTRP